MELDRYYECVRLPVEGPNGYATAVFSAVPIWTSDPVTGMYAQPVGRCHIVAGFRCPTCRKLFIVADTRDLYHECFEHPSVNSLIDLAWKCLWDDLLSICRK